MNKTQLFKHTILATVLATLAACGGGGGGSDNGGGGSPAPTPTVPQGSSGDSATLDQATYTGEKLAAFNALNDARAAVGLKPVKQNTRLDQTAQAHADYLVLNDASGHNEDSTKPGFTGADPFIRAKGAGYTASSSEGITGGIGNVSGRREVEHLITGLYHRVPMLNNATVDFGVGLANKTTSEWILYDSVLTYGFANDPFPIGSGYFVWPVDNASNIPVYMGAENPDPAPDRAYNQRGYPVSVTTNPGDKITVDVFKMNCAGSDLPARIITKDNDIHQRLQTNWVFLLTEVALPVNATCSVTFQGSSPALGSFNKTWSFTTEGARG